MWCLRDLERLHRASSQTEKNNNNKTLCSNGTQLSRTSYKLVYLFKHVFVGMHQISMQDLCEKGFTRVMSLVILLSRNSELDSTSMERKDY